ncbi:MAG: tripartite tricarboxylate transporter substrate binding protein [Acetobacteraceae bacterium]|nr:tripartite tricarboxylate transporter substrate binding protein [Acetobacteraceae bacterium]
MHPGRRDLLAASLILGTPAASRAQAPDWPRARSIRLIVPFPAGGPTDAIARLLAAPMGQTVGQTIVVENRAGAGGNVGAEAAARAEPDGYTIVVTSIATHGIGPALYPRLPFDPVRDFASIGMLHVSPLVVAVRPDFAARSLAELVRMAQARPGEIGYATSGNGTSPHAAGEMFAGRAGIRWQHVPYRGSAPAITDVLAGNVPVLIDNLISTVEHIRAGRLRALAVTTAERSPLLPDVPTVAEQGFAGYAAASWMALAAPARTPPAVIAALNAALNAALAQAEVRRGLLALGAVPVGGSPAELDAFVQAELAKWAAVVRQSGMRLD